MEFVSNEEVRELLREHGIAQSGPGQAAATGDQAATTLRSDVAHYHIRCNGSGAKPVAGAKVIVAEKDKLADMFEHILHLLSLSQVVLLPVGKWRGVFDAVAFSLAEHEDWQEFDASVTVELNTRDPLVCDAADFHTLVELVRALLRDAESPEQGVTVLCGNLPVLMEIVPDGAMRLSLGSQALADELADVLGG